MLMDSNGGGNMHDRYQLTLKTVETFIQVMEDSFHCSLILRKTLQNFSHNGLYVVLIRIKYL